ncbi:Uncharacterised protein [uncultured archaeon]|nr:Uncharacterised protein [uncultured archaeon]
MKKIFLLALALFVLLPFSLAVTCSDAGVTSFVKNATLTGTNLSLDLNISYKSNISVYDVNIVSPDSRVVAADSFTPQSLTGAPKTVLINRPSISLSKTGAYTYRLLYYINGTSPVVYCVSSGSFTVLPAKSTSTVPDTSIFAILAALACVVALISFRKK